MRVVVCSSTRLPEDSLQVAVAAALADSGHDVIPLSITGLGSPSRPLTPAEVHLARSTLLGADPLASAADAGCRGTVIGYVCRGRKVGPGQSPDPEIVAATDHVGLTWESPLRGPNDDRLGPRFPRSDGVYAPDAALERLHADPPASGWGVTISTATVAGVRDDHALTQWEQDMVDALQLKAVSSELVPVAVIAAHLGLRLAAAVILQPYEGKGDALWSTTM